MKFQELWALFLALLLLGVLPACGPDDDDTSADDDDSAAGDDDSAAGDDDSAGDDDDSAPPLPVDADGDGFAEEEDCNDDDAAIHPAATELCDQVDNDCDGATDESDASDAPTWYQDSDGDGYGLDTNEQVACYQPHGYSAYPGDCNDTDPTYHPGAAEADCTDPEDYNCDNSVGYADVDGDGVAACEDCDDNNGAVHPAATEACNSIDDDCDTLVDEQGATGESTWFLDADGDGYGRSTLSQVSCAQPLGYVGNSDDCDDLDATSYPGGTEVCDGADNNCDQATDEGVTTSFYGDADGDGYGDPGTVLQACSQPIGASSNLLDCDDSAPSAHPGGIELCDGIDNDCDNSIDNGALDADTWYADLDTDGFGAGAGTVSCTAITGSVTNAGDCDDGDGDNYPGNAEICDGRDNNCNAGVDEGLDLDGDGVTPCGADGVSGNSDDDCDDSDSASYPGNVELCDSIDNDCDGSADVGALDADTWYVDGDDDGFGAGLGTTSCAALTGSVVQAGDCDDGDDTAYPGNTETCDGVDNDCAGGVDDGVATTFYADTDGDGYGNSSDSLDACSLPSGYVTDTTDCDDTQETVYPGNTEICDGLDNDCNGPVDDSCINGTCKTIFDLGAHTGDGLYTLDPEFDGVAPFEAYCNMSTDGGGWTLVASFVNTDSTVSWSRPTGDVNWRNTSTFGSAGSYQSADYKSVAYSSLTGNDIMVTDANGFVSFDTPLAGSTMLSLLTSYTSCQTTALMEPGDPNIASSSATYASTAMLAFYTGDPNSGDRCAFDGTHNDSTMIAISGTGCGSMGLGQWGTNYNQGMDWHATLNESDVCVACDQCGPWHGLSTVTSATHNNNSGPHDNSTWAALWVR